MLGDVVEAALEVGRVVVVTNDRAVVPGGAEVVNDPGNGMNSAVAEGLARVEGHALVVNADLPCATPDSLRELAAAGLALVEAPDGTTNALGLPYPEVFQPLYGPRSAAQFRAHAVALALPFEDLTLRNLVEDVDTITDLERVGMRSGPRTRAVLGAISAPVAVLLGSDTKPFFTASARHVADHVPNARIHEIPGAGHAAPLTHPEALAKALTEFFTPAQQPA